MESFNDVCISEIRVISGVRPKGRTTDRSESGRKNHGILFIWKGGVSFRVADEATLDVKAGETLYIPKGLKYKMEFTVPDTTFVLVNFKLFTAKGEEKRLSERLGILAGEEKASRIFQVLSKLELCGAAQSVLAGFRKKELVYRLLSIVYESGASLGGQQMYPQIFAGVLLLEQSFLENLPVSEFAKASNISISQFRSLFHKQYGLSPVQYRNRLRINRATELLSEGSCTVSEAAYASGFENVGYFCRYYKRITGKTPLQEKLGEAE